MRIGMFGGTFNPPHLGHLLLAERVVESLGLDTLLFVPAAIPPHKIGDPAIAANDHRVAMLRRAVAGEPRFDVSTIEIDRDGISYTVDTLRTLRGLHPDAELFLLLGADNLTDFHTWRDPAGICGLARLVVLQRAGFPLEAVDATLRERAVIVPAPTIEISAREIRQRVREGKSIRYYVPAGVAEYIEREGLYR